MFMIVVCPKGYLKGLSIEAVVNTLKEKLGDNMPNNIKVATIYYKPKRNKTGKVPDYYVKDSDEWIVFPHELEGLSIYQVGNVIGVETAELLEESMKIVGKKNKVPAREDWPYFDYCEYCACRRVDYECFNCDDIMSGRKKFLKDVLEEYVKYKPFYDSCDYCNSDRTDYVCEKCISNGRN